jgi:hypothetical protein
LFVAHVGRQKAGIVRTVHWLFAVSTALFVASIGLVIAAAKTARDAPPPEPSMTTPVATVRQIMKGITSPAAEAVFDAVSTTVSFSGIEEHAPRNDAEWETVGASAAALIESGNLLMMGSRAVDKGDWIAMSRALVDAGELAVKATEAKSPNDLLAAGEAVNTSCNNCHRKYQRGS